MKILVAGHSVNHYRQRKMWEWIAEQGNKVTAVVVPRYADEVNKPMKKGSFELITSIPYGGDYWHFPEMVDIVKKYNPDVLMCYQEPFNYVTYHVLSVAKIYNKPFAFFTWENIRKAFPIPERLLEAYVIKESDLAIGGNSDAARILLEKGARNVEKTLQTGLDPNLFAPAPRLNLDQRVEPRKLLFVGRLVEEKGVLNILKLFDKLDKKYVLKFVGGRGPLEQNIKEHPEFGKRITYEPWMDYTKLPEIYNWADVLLAPSLDKPQWIEQCILGGTNIITFNKTYPISNIQMDEEVLTFDGDKQKVKEVMKRKYSGEMIKIVPLYFAKGCDFTPEHPILIIKGKRCEQGYICSPRCKCKDYRKGNCAKLYYKNYKLEWEFADNVTINDFLVYPKLRIEGKTIPKIEYERKNGHRPSTKESITINYDLMRLAGYWLAEGSVSKKGQIRFSFNCNEKEEIEDVCEITKKELNRSPSIVTQNNCSIVQFRHSKFGEFLISAFNKGAKNKSIDFSKIPTNDESLTQLLIGYIKGDGHIDENEISATSASESLIYSIWRILLHFDILGGISETYSKESIIRGRTIGARKKYNIYVRGNPDIMKLAKLLKLNEKIYENKGSSKYWADEKFYYLPVKSIDKYEVNDLEVHNIRVSEKESYLLPFFAVHNCSYVIGEALLCHVPVITSISKSIVELWKVPGVTFVPQGDIDLMLEMVLSDNTYKPTVDGRQEIIKRYSYENIGNLYLKMLGDLV